MLALQLDTDIKTFMGRLLREDIFDQFEVRTAEIHAGVLTTINGLLDSGEFDTWANLRNLAFNIIKLSPKPKYVKIVFAYKTAETTDIHNNAAALFLNFTYESDADGDKVTFTTGTSQKEFIFEKSLDQDWDQWVSGFFAAAGINVFDRE